QEVVPLGFKGTWAAALVSGEGYMYIDDSGGLHHVSAGGVDTVISESVGQAAVAPGGERLAFDVAGPSSSVIWGYDVGLQARYRLGAEKGPSPEHTWGA